MGTEEIGWVLFVVSQCRASRSSSELTRLASLADVANLQTSLTAGEAGLGIDK